ncbi:MAG: class I SAM-dependent methyltransferase [Fimbriimonadales bacterium]
MPQEKFFPNPSHVDSIPWSSDLAPVVSTEHYPTWILSSEHRYYGYLRLLIEEFEPSSVVELGTFQGISALFMKSALPVFSKLTTIDIHPVDNLLTQILKLDTRVRLVSGDTRDPDIVKEFGIDQVDFLYIDTDHNFRQIAAEWDVWRPVLANGAIVVLDDIHLNPEMEFFWNQIPFVKLDTGKILHHSGFGLFQYHQ